MAQALKRCELAKRYASKLIIISKGARLAPNLIAKPTNALIRVKIPQNIIKGK